MAKLSFTVLQNADFRRLLFTRMCGMMALQAQAIIVGWQIYSITKDPFMLGLIGLTEAVPAIICALFAGHIVDISRPLRVYLICLSVLALNTIALFLVAGGVLTHEHNENIIPWLYAGVFISGLARAFIMPSTFSILPQIISRANIPAASAWMSSGFQIAAIAGPAIAGIVYGGFGVKAAWLIPVVLMITAVCMVIRMSTGVHQYRSNSPREKAAKSIIAGWKFIWRHDVLLAVMALDMFAILFGNVVAILPAYADQVLHAGSEELGALRAAPAIGAIVSALYLAVWPMQKIHSRHLLYIITAFGFCMIGIGLAETFMLAMVLLVLSGLVDSVSMVIRATLMQLLIPDDMRGRVSSVNSMFIISSNEIGAFRAGTMAAWLGLVPSIVIGGAATLGVAAVAAWRVPKLRSMIVDADSK